MTNPLSLILFLTLATATRHEPAAFLGQSNQKGEETSNGVLYVGGLATIPKNASGVLDVEDNESLRIRWEGGRWELPYERIQVLYVSVSRPPELRVAATKKCYLSIQYEEPNSQPQKCFFIIKGNSASGVLVALEKKSNRPLVFESEEARRRAVGTRK